MSISRRALLIATPAFLAGCVSEDYQRARQMYAALPEEEFPLRAVPLQEIEPELRRQRVAYEGDQPAGTIVVDTAERYLYYVMEDDQAIRYGIGVGREGLAFRGTGKIGRKSEWPNWTPTANMIRRDPRNRQFADGVPGGLNNPLGARALYLYRNGRDTMFRIHGTNQPKSIGHAMSSGCIRMLNHDVIDLYERAPVGTKVVVRQA